MVHGIAHQLDVEQKKARQAGVVTCSSCVIILYSSTHNLVSYIYLFVEKK